MSIFSDLCKKIPGEYEFNTKLPSFFDQVIRCELTLVDTNQVLLQIRLSALGTNNASAFAFQLNNDTNLIISQVQMHSRTHNATCFKYGYNKN